MAMMFAAAILSLHYDRRKHSASLAHDGRRIRTGIRVDLEFKQAIEEVRSRCRLQNDERRR
jgi:hypothetical protein